MYVIFETTVGEGKENCWFTTYTIDHSFIWPTYIKKE